MVLYIAEFLIDKLTVAQLVKKFPSFYEIRTFITFFIRALMLRVSLVTRSQRVLRLRMEKTSCRYGE
jgi:hypothetical protein